MSARVAEFPEYLTDEQKVPRHPGRTGQRDPGPDANIIKLPNIERVNGQLKACIRNCSPKGYAIPDYPENPSTREEKALAIRYGSVWARRDLNPVLA